MLILKKRFLSIFPEALLKQAKFLFQLNKLFFTDKIFIWSIAIFDTKLKYKFNSLYQGILSNRQDKASTSNFRRNIHRLEKGLSYPEIKGVFAEEYILETVCFLQENTKKQCFDDNTKRWGEAVLDLYFKTCKHTSQIAKAYKIYQKVKTNINTDKLTPYCANLRPKLTVDYDTLYQLAVRRRSIRFYLSKKVDSSVVTKAMKIAALSPSACNRQSFKFLFFNETNLVKKISEIPGGVSGYTIPSVAIVVGSYEGYFDERDINAPIIDSSLSVMAFLFALETLGLSSVCINWPNLIDREEKIRQLIDLKKDEFVVMLIGIGYPSPKGKIPYSAKKEIEDLLLINQRIKSSA